MLYYSSTELVSFGNLLSFGSISFGYFTIAPVTIFCTVGVINSINMIDGLDGLAGGISLVAFIAAAVRWSESVSMLTELDSLSDSVSIEAFNL